MYVEREMVIIVCKRRKKRGEGMCWPCAFFFFYLSIGADEETR